MRKIWSILGLLLALAPAAAAQTTPIPSTIRLLKTDDGSCTIPGWSFTLNPNTGVARIGTNTVAICTNGVKRVDWNTARMLLASGFSLQVGANTLTTSDLLDATKLSGTVPLANGGGLTAAADDTVAVGNGSAWQAKTIADCQGAGKAMTYTQSSNTFGCNTIASGGFAWNIVAKTASYAAALNDLVEQTSGSSITLTLPAASTCTSTSYAVGLKNDTANVITVARTGSDTIDGVAGSFSTYGVQYESFDFICNAAKTGWMIR